VTVKKVASQPPVGHLGNKADLTPSLKRSGSNRCSLARETNDVVSVCGFVPSTDTTFEPSRNQCIPTEMEMRGIEPLS